MNMSTHIRTRLFAAIREQMQEADEITSDGITSADYCALMADIAKLANESQNACIERLADAAREFDEELEQVPAWDRDGFATVSGNLDEAREELKAAREACNAPADPLTIAYISFGACEHMRRHGGLPDAVVERYQGQIEFMSALIEGAALLDRLGEEAGDKLSAVVWAYDIAETYGEKMCAAMITDVLQGTSYANPATIAAAIIADNIIE